MRRIFSVALCCVCLTGCVSVNKGSRPMGSIVDNREALPQPGEWCRITYPETRSGLLERQQSVVTGKVESVDEDGLRLSEVTGRHMVKTPLVQKVPVIRRYFKNTGVGMEHDRFVQLDGTEQVEIISEQEGRGCRPQMVAENLLAAVPGRNRLP